MGKCANCNWDVKRLVRLPNANDEDSVCDSCYIDCLIEDGELTGEIDETH